MRTHCEKSLAVLIALVVLTLLPCIADAQLRPEVIRLASGVVLNEIMFDPNGADAGGEWVELFNGGRRPASLDGWVISTASTREAARLPDLILPPGAYLTVRFGRGLADSDFTDGAGTFATGVPAEVFGNSSDGVALYRCAPSPRCIVDYVSWGFAPLFRAPTREADAVTAGIWSAGARFASGLFATEGNSLGRDAQALDTDTPDDWEGWGGIEATGPTPGGANFGELGYQTQSGRDPCRSRRLRNVDAGDRRRFEAQVLAALQQLRGRFAELFPGLDPGLGDRPPRVRRNGDIVIGDVVIRAGRNLNPGGRRALGRACPPERFRGRTRIYLDIDGITDLWQMKEVIYHELVHVALFRNRRAGYWLPGGRPATRATDDDTRGLVTPTHEAVAYVLDLRLLESLLVEFSAQQDAIRTRMSKKVQYMEMFLQQALRNRDSLTNPFYRDALRRLIDRRLREFLVWKVWQANRDGNLERAERDDIVRVGGLLGLGAEEVQRMLQGCVDRVSFLCEDLECGGGVCCRDEVTPPEDVACDDLEDPCQPPCPRSPRACREVVMVTCTNGCPGGRCCADQDPPPGEISCFNRCVPGTPWCPQARERRERGDN